MFTLSAALVILFLALAVLVYRRQLKVDFGPQVSYLDGIRNMKKVSQSKRRLLARRCA